MSTKVPTNLFDNPPKLPHGNSVHFSSATDVWATPQSLFDELNAEFTFSLDVCALPENAKCDRYFTPETDEDKAVRARFAAKVGASGGAADPKAISHEGHRRQLADFVEAVQGNRPPKVDGREGRKSVDLICAIYESNRTGKVVELR